jgi:NAD(P)-dependent dehydrogenase (short-subunit alcohol dehydrogenase family)
MTKQPLMGRVALVAGATHGAGRQIAVQLRASGATVYATGRSTRGHRSEMDRPETIEETAELVTAAGGTGVAVAVDHLVPEQVGALVQRIDTEQGRLDVLVNDVWGGDADHLAQAGLGAAAGAGFRLLRLAVDTHVITCHFALPLLIRQPGGLVLEIGDRTTAYSDKNYRLSVFYDLAKWSVKRLAFAWSQELAAHGATAVALTPGWLRSEMLPVYSPCTPRVLRCRKIVAGRPQWSVCQPRPGCGSVTAGPYGG